MTSSTRADDAGWRSALVLRWQSRNLGSLPVLAALLVICVVFQSLNSTFLSSDNLVNLTMQTAAAGTVAVGVVLVLLVGQIDLSVGSVSGLASAIVAVTFVQLGWPLTLGIVAAVLAGSAVGLVYGLLFSRLGVPSFVITVAGLLAVGGLQLRVLGSTGSVNLPFDSWLVQFCQRMFLPPAVSFALVAVATIAYAWRQLAERRRRTEAELAVRPASTIFARAAVLATGGGLAVWYLDQSRGVGYLFALFLAVVLVTDGLLQTTPWGRSVYAVGGNVDAARRAGLPVRTVFVSVFVACSTLAALGGVLAVGRLAAANQGSGAGDLNLTAIAAAVIGGTSLFGGRGSARSALLGVLVIQSVSSGLTLLNQDTSVRQIITAAVLVFAVTVDAVARRSRLDGAQA